MNSFPQPLDFSGLFTLEMANNHQGSVEHGLRIIRECAEVVNRTGVKAAVKFQFRDLDTFIHPDFKGVTDPAINKHIPRFESTRLNREEFGQLIAEVKRQGLLTMATPFDEASLAMFQSFDIDILKIASCSAKDWPLLEKAVLLRKPMIVSLGGMYLEEVDRLVSFLEHRAARFALQHCVAIYPTPTDKLQLTQLKRLKERYPHLTIGYSTHEPPEAYDTIKLAYALGARIFERHVGVATESVTLNKYSSTPEQLEKWIVNYQEAVAALGEQGETEPAHDPQELADLVSLQRGVYCRRNVQAGEILQEQDVFFAMPLQPGQLMSGQWKAGKFVSDQSYQALKPILVVVKDSAVSKEDLNKEVVYRAVRNAKAMLNKAKIDLGLEFEMEVSHHYGLDKFSEFGCLMATCINREYCKKIIIQFPGQAHPTHHHMKKEEMFQVLFGEMEATIEGRKRTLYPGDTLLVQRGVRHGFTTSTGVIFEEISSTHFNDDSIYDDPYITQLPRPDRKTKLSNWGRYHFD